MDQKKGRQEEGFPPVVQGDEGEPTPPTTEPGRGPGYGGGGGVTPPGGDPGTGDGTGSEGGGG
jgi:hypothetical protein